jgi:3-oxoacyl-[acyl-carrier protein] reductase
LNGKVAAVTGASKGIGAGIAKDPAAHGASVVVNYFSSKESADKIVAEIVKAGGKAIALGGSVAKPEEIDRLFAETKKAYGKVDILVNNAGVYAFSPIETLTIESISAIFSVNVFGLLLATKAALPLFSEEGGSIINIGSVVGEMAPAQASVYVGTKGELNSIT